MLTDLPCEGGGDCTGIYVGIGVWGVRNAGFGGGKKAEFQLGWTLGLLA